MGIPLIDQLELILRLLVAGICGAIIGYERESHLKTAGIRTHSIVALAAGLMMLISKYGFNDLVLANSNIVKLDPSRFAAGAVTAIGFLGAGVIFVRKQNVSGLTTAAGIWATVGVGMAIGAGMYIIGAIVTALTILVHFILHRRSRLVKDALSEQVVLVISMDQDLDQLFSDIFSTRNIDIINFKAKRIDDVSLEVRLFVRYPDTYEIPDIMKLLNDVPSIKSIEI